MSLADRNSGTHFLTPLAYNRFRRLISRRSDSSFSDTESIQSSLAKEEQGHGHLTLSAYNRFRSLVSRRSDSSFSDAESIQSSQAEEQVFSTRDQRERGFSKVLSFFFLKPNVAGKRTLHGLHKGDSGRFSDRNRGSSEIAEHANRQAEIARLMELQTLKGHVESIMKRKGLDMENIQLYYTV